MQESIVNRKVKQITMRQSSFRLVELAGFMALLLYLDMVLSGLDIYDFKHNAN